MGTNYYGYIKPSRANKNFLKKLIDEDEGKYEALKNLFHKMYGGLFYDYEEEKFNGCYVHLGKRSGGWKFLWNPNWEFKLVDFKAEPWQWEMVSPYPLTKKGIKDFIDREDVEIYDEYGCKQDKEEFWNMALNWGYEKYDIGYDAGTYEGKYPEEKKYVCDNELIRLLEKEGYKFSSVTKSDFYSDGLRFSTNTDFC